MIRAPPQFLLRVLENPEYTIQLDDQLKEIRPIHKIDGTTSFLAHLLYKAVWPTAPRDFAFLGMACQWDDDTWIDAVCSIQDSRIPEEKGYVRADLLIGGYVIKACPGQPEMSDVTYIFKLDLKGNVPTFIVNKIGQAQPLCVNTLRNFAEPLYVEMKKDSQRLKEFEDTYPILPIAYMAQLTTPSVPATATTSLGSQLVPTPAPTAETAPTKVGVYTQPTSGPEDVAANIGGGLIEVEGEREGRQETGNPTQFGGERQNSDPTVVGEWMGRQNGMEASDPVVVEGEWAWIENEMETVARQSGDGENLQQLPPVAQRWHLMDEETRFTTPETELENGTGDRRLQHPMDEEVRFATPITELEDGARGQLEHASSRPPTLGGPTSPAETTGTETTDTPRDPSSATGKSENGMIVMEPLDAYTPEELSSDEGEPKMDEVFWNSRPSHPELILKIPVYQDARRDSEMSKAVSREKCA